MLSFRSSVSVLKLPTAASNLMAHGWVSRKIFKKPKEKTVKTWSSSQQHEKKPVRYSSRHANSDVCKSSLISQWKKGVLIIHMFYNE